MKKLFLILSFLASSILSFSQAQLPDSIANKSVTISLKGRYHALIYELMPGRDATEAINYVIQVREAAGEAFDTAQNITVTVSYKLVADMYYIIGSQQERLTASDNKAIEEALLPQLYVLPYQDLLQIIGEIKQKNKDQTEAIRQSGISRIMAIRL